MNVVRMSLFTDTCFRLCLNKVGVKYILQLNKTPSSIFNLMKDVLLCLFM
jgi:hypothetical protein